MSYNPDKNKQAQKLAFSRKRSKPKHPQLLFNKTPVAYSFSQNHLGITLEKKLTLTNHIKLEKTERRYRNVIKSLNNTLS